VPALGARPVMASARASRGTGLRAGMRRPTGGRHRDEPGRAPASARRDIRHRIRSPFGGIPGDPAGVRR